MAVGVDPQSPSALLDEFICAGLETQTTLIVAALIFSHVRVGIVINDSQW